jgi:GNAT superfamily N-acetyltransferase
MKRIYTLMTGLMALAACCTQEARADRYSDYWAPENMAKRQCTSVHLHYGPTIPKHTAAYQETVIEKSAPGTYFACNNFGCGYIGVQEICGEAYITNVAVFANHRKNGVGRLLLKTAQNGARARKCEFITLEVRVSNVPAISLYESEGYGDSAESGGRD